jgi:uncharacterized C2H2 Zn-finger protein
MVGLDKDEVVRERQQVESRYKCSECDKEFNAHGAYMQHVNYDHRKSKKTFLQTASQLLIGFPNFLFMRQM